MKAVPNETLFLPRGATLRSTSFFSVVFLPSNPRESLWCLLHDEILKTHAPWDLFAYSLSRQECTWQHFFCIFILRSSSRLLSCLLCIMTNRNGNLFLYSSILRRFRNIAKSDYYLCHVCLSVHQLGIIRLPLEELS